MYWQSYLVLNLNCCKLQLLDFPVQQTSPLQWRDNERDASQITSISNVSSTLCSCADQRKHQSSASLAVVRGIHRWPVDSPHKGPITLKLFPFDDVIMYTNKKQCYCQAISWLFNTPSWCYRWKLYLKICFRCIIWSFMCFITTHFHTELEAYWFLCHKVEISVTSPP